jgi:hypothetical protein
MVCLCSKLITIIQGAWAASCTLAVRYKICSAILGHISVKAVFDFLRKIFCPIRLNNFRPVISTYCTKRFQKLYFLRRKSLKRRLCWSAKKQQKMHIFKKLSFQVILYILSKFLIRHKYAEFYDYEQSCKNIFTYYKMPWKLPSLSFSLCQYF